MVMSNLETRSLIMFFFLCLLLGCKDKKSKELNQKRILYKTYSIKQVGDQEYVNVFNAANDSLKNWTNNHLSAYAIYEENGWYLDNLICFNENGDRCVMALSYRLYISPDYDGMSQFYGAKIKGQWYFFRGGAFHLSRKAYVSADSIKYPLNFKILDEIAMKNIFRGYLKKNSKDEWEINDAFFTYQLEDVGWGDFKRQSHKDTLENGEKFTSKKEYFESKYLRKSKEKWLYREK